MFKSSVELDNKPNIIDLLNEMLANAADLKMQSKQAHWNVKGPSFYSYHQLFDSVAEHFDDYADTIAERIAQLGGVVNGTMQQAVNGTTMPEYDTNAFEGIEVIKTLANSVAAFANATRKCIDVLDSKFAHDIETQDIFIEIGRQADKDLWFLESHLN